MIGPGEIVYFDMLTDTQRIAIAVYRAVLDVERQEFEVLDALAQRFRDAVDAGDLDGAES